MAARHRSRTRALQVLFFWDMRREPIDRAIAHFYDTLHSDEAHEPVRLKPDKFMEELARGAVSHAAEIDKKIEANSANWRLERMAAVDRNILRLAIYELQRKDIPGPIVIDEAMELARQFSSDESLSFINGILDAVNRQGS